MAGIWGSDPGRASGVNNPLQRFGVAAVTAVFTTYGQLGSSAGVIAGYRPALAVSAALSLLGALTALAIAPRRRATQPLPPLAPPQRSGREPVPGLEPTRS